MAALSMREAYGRALADYGELNPNVVTLDADTSSSTMSKFFAQKFPERFFNIGIAEPCMVDVAVGLALGGRVPFANAFAALMSLRALEQIRTCVCYARTNVKLISGYAGVSDFKDGPTHHSVLDISIMRALPEMTVVVAADAAEAAAFVPVIAEYDGPVYLRLSRAASLPVHEGAPQLEIGKGIVLRPGSDVTIVAAGTMAGRSLLAAKQLAEEGIEAQVIDAHTIKPLDETLLLESFERTGAVVTAEEHSIIGGLGGAVAELLTAHRPLPLERVGILDTFTRTAPDPDCLMDAYGMGVADVVTAAKKVLTRRDAQG
jgi:transketolase